MTAPRNKRRGRRLIAGGLLGAAIVSSSAPVRRAALERALRVRATFRDPVAPFMAAPCHAPGADGRGVPDAALETIDRPV